MAFSRKDVFGLAIVCVTVYVAHHVFNKDNISLAERKSIARAMLAKSHQSQSWDFPPGNSRNKPYTIIKKAPTKDKHKEKQAKLRKTIRENIMKRLQMNEIENNYTNIDTATANDTDTTQEMSIIQKGCNKTPDVLIIGFEKCGTMALKEYLNIHPGIFAPKEPNDRFFNPEMNQTFNEYKSDMQCTPKTKLKVEKMAISGLPVKAHKLNPNLKLIATVRDPVERAISHFTHRVAFGLEKEGTIDTVINGLLDENYKIAPASVIFNQGMYYERLKSWLKYFNASQIHVVDGDRFVRHPSKELSLVETFLGLRHAITSRKFVFNKDKGFYCIKNKNVGTCMNEGKGRPHPTVNASTIARLKDFFRPHNKAFFQFLGREFPWNY